MTKQDKEHIEKLADDFDLPVEVVKAIVSSPYDFMRKNSKDLLSIRLQGLGLIAVKPNRLKYFDERRNKKRGKSNGEV